MNQRQRAALASKYKTDGMTGTSPQKLLLAIFERVQRDLATSVAAIDQQRVEAAHKALVNAQDLIHELNMALEPDVWPAASEMRSIYMHLLDLLVEANTHKTIAPILAAQELVDPLAESWREAVATIQAQKLEAVTAAAEAQQQRVGSP